jgi:hypothetical protein
MARRRWYTEAMKTLLTERGEITVSGARAEVDRLWLSDADLERATSWALKPEGLCRGSTCVPIPAGRGDEIVRSGRIDVAAFWRHLDRSVVHSADGSVWVLGEAAAERATALRSLEAPDFALPDPAGRMHSLSDHRGKKVLLVSWASW